MSGEFSVSQKRLFLSDEGNHWYERNKWNFSSAIKDDPILKAIEIYMLTTTRVLEIGCSDGWRLAEIEKRYGSTGYGIDPSQNAITAGNISHPKLHLSVGTADELPNIEPVDLIIFGFCLYLCDPQDLFKIAMESDRLLKDKGHIIVLDFHPPIGHYRNPYSHRDGIFSYKMDYSKLFTWHPSYCTVYCHMSHHLSKETNQFSPDDMVSVQIIRKDSILLSTKSSQQK